MRRTPQSRDYLKELLVQWRTQAEAYELDSALGRGDQVLRRAAEELEQALRLEAGETLNLQAVSRESGYSADHLGRLVKRGMIPNAGRPKAPRIHRSDLPRKSGRGIRTPTLAAARREAALSRDPRLG